MDIPVWLAVSVVILLAAADLWSGVANDAVNFLNSAIGSRVASFRVAMLVTGAGIVLGTLGASGLMEVARSGVFDPAAFVDPATGTVQVRHLIAIYLGVMVADVLLLDGFNSLGLPTSTTVAVISELAGASLAAALWTLPGGWPAALGVIRAGPLLGIYTGIFLSVAVAFAIGALAMLVVRLAYGRDPDRGFRQWGWLWVGGAAAVLGHFVVLKGIAGPATGRHGLLPPGIVRGFSPAAFVIAAWLAWIGRNHPRRVLGGLILAGTAALAAAFAGNDLVNFIGPAVAAVHTATRPDHPPGAPAGTHPAILLGAGVWMVLAVAVSRKARRVTDTEVRLAGHSAMPQRFRAHAVAHGIVRWGHDGLRLGSRSLPARWRNWLTTRMAPPPADEDHPAYDPLRASVNLTVSAALIALGTSWHLPLSTTYITFATAMGAALGDFAWSRHDAPARIAGILVVLGGWMVTGVLAAIGAFIATSCLVLWGQAGMILCLAALAGTLWRLHPVRIRRHAGTMPSGGK